MSKKNKLLLKIVLETCFPVLEIWIIVELINNFGGLLTLLLVLLSTIIGMVLTIWHFREYFKNHRIVTKLSKDEELSREELFEFVRCFGAVGLVLTPGFISDMLGFLCLYKPIGDVIAWKFYVALDVDHLENY